MRRALYWSLLVSPTAGVTYGHHGIWPWMEERGIPLDHEQSGEAPPWQEALHSEGADSVTHLHRFFASLDWWKLRPAPHLLVEQPGEEDAIRTMVAARAEDDSFAVVYTPGGDVIVLAQSVLAFDQARWYDPRRGEWIEAGEIGPDRRFPPPAGEDWLLVLA